jgi:hypothetical protein
MLALQQLSHDGVSTCAVIRVKPLGARVDEGLAAAALACRPTLAEHACKQRGFGRFGDGLLGTTLPHLVEHIALDLLVEDVRTAGGGEDGGVPSPPLCAPIVLPIAGNTVWADRRQGLMKVRVSAGTPSAAAAAAAALRRAVTLVNDLLAH